MDVMHADDYVIAALAIVAGIVAVAGSWPRCDAEATIGALLVLLGIVAGVAPMVERRG